MPKLMLINVTHPEESRVAIVTNRVLESFEIESLSREHLKGNIYKGVVHRIHPALEAAFVDIGAERDAFLPLDEICFRNLTTPPAEPGPDENGKKPRRRIRELLKPGEEILVQIAKEPFANKPPTLTTFYSLPGRYLVLLPGSDDTGISRRIEGDERQRLRQLVESLNPPEGFGLIVRTAAGLDEDTGELSRDLTYLQRLWSSIQAAAAQKRAPALVYREQDIVLRTIRDLFTPDVDEIYVDNEDVFLRARDFLRAVMPGREHVLRCYRGEQPIFSGFDLEAQIETVFKRRVPLRSGGTIVIDGTEALTAIDVNSGGSVRGPNPEETAFRTNLEAAAEVARQLRLRDIGGLIVVDFIDMREPRHIHEVEQELRTALKPDKARHEVGRISRLGLLEISRQRMRPAAMATTYTSCPMCDGHGAVRTTESAALVALRKMHNRVALGDVATLRAALPPAVALYLLNQKRDELAHLEQRYATRLHVELAERLMPHQIELEVRERAVAEAPPAVAPGAVASADPAAATNGGGPAAPEAGAGKKRRRRRGRKRGSGLRAAVAIGEALASLGGQTTADPHGTAGPDLAPPFDRPPETGSANTADSLAHLHPWLDGGPGAAEPSAAPSPAGGTDLAAGVDAPAARRGRSRRGGRKRRGSARADIPSLAAAPLDGALGEDDETATAAAATVVTTDPLPTADEAPVPKQPRQRRTGARSPRSKRGANQVGTARDGAKKPLSRPSKAPPGQRKRTRTSKANTEAAVPPAEPSVRPGALSEPE